MAETITIAGETKSRNLFGRRTIYTGLKQITRENVADAVQAAMTIHAVNAGEIDYLWNYYRGNQPILQRVKQIRPEICNKVVVNRANEIVTFKVGYLCGEPIQYVSKSSGEDVTKSVITLNDYMDLTDKNAVDREVVEWMMVAGIGNKIVLPGIRGEEAPFRQYSLDPRTTFVCYSSQIGHEPVFGVSFTREPESEEITYGVYTADRYFELVGDKVVEERGNPLGAVPIIEYPTNHARLGAFENVVSMLDAINMVASNRIDGVEQFVQSFLKFINCDIDEEKFKALQELGGIKVRSVDGQKADVEIVTSELNQQQTQTLVDDMYQTVLDICGMPNRNGGSSTSDTGSAVIMRDGWSLAEARAKDTEILFKASENRFLKMVLRYCEGIGDLKLKQKDIDIKFTRRNYENIQSKAQVLVSMLQQPQIHPLLSFTSCGLFSDPEAAYNMSQKYYETYMAQAIAREGINREGQEKTVKQNETAEGTASPNAKE